MKNDYERSRVCSINALRSIPPTKSLRREGQMGLTISPETAVSHIPLPLLDITPIHASILPSPIDSMVEVTPVRPTAIIKASLHPRACSKLGGAVAGLAPQAHRRRKLPDPDTAQVARGGGEPADA